MKQEESRLVADLAARHWLRGDQLQAMAPAAHHLHVSRFKVAGLNDLGRPQPESRVHRAFNAVDSMFDENDRSGYVAVRGDHPQCAAVGMYQAARFDHAWVVITSHRVAVLRLQDKQSNKEAAFAEFEQQGKDDRSLGGALRGIGKLVKDSATEFVKSARRPPLVERPQDAVFECSFEVPRQALHSIVPWKIPLVPEFSGGPRLVQVQFTDNSWTRLETDQTGRAALTGS